MLSQHHHQNKKKKVNLFHLFIATNASCTTYTDLKNIQSIKSLLNMLEEWHYLSKFVQFFLLLQVCEEDIKMQKWQ